MTIITDPRKIRLFQLMCARSAVKLEIQGLRFRGGSVKAKWAKHFGLRATTSRQIVLARIEQEIDGLQAELGI